MIVSIHDVPAHERHLLFIADLDQPRRRTRPNPIRSELKAINRSLNMYNEAVDIRTLLPRPIGLPLKPGRGAA